ncbi:MAG: hypothetical protein L7F78_26035 [Syntrophales bacterium LBB04]|nr:hypothetical protein [Syntrophales bacterium LBB04]
MTGIGNVTLGDYEYGRPFPLAKPAWLIVPEAIPNDVLYCPLDRIRKYPGLKEDVYAPRFKPDPSLRSVLHMNESEIVVTVRPPATEAHYHNPESEILFEKLMQILSVQNGVFVALAIFSGQCALTKEEKA